MKIWPFSLRNTVSMKIEEPNQIDDVNLSKIAGDLASGSRVVIDCGPYRSSKAKYVADELLRDDTLEKIYRFDRYRTEAKKSSAFMWREFCWHIYVLMNKKTAKYGVDQSKNNDIKEDKHSSSPQHFYSTKVPLIPVDCYGELEPQFEEVFGLLERLGAADIKEEKNTFEGEDQPPPKILKLRKEKYNNEIVIDLTKANTLDWNELLPRLISYLIKQNKTVALDCGVPQFQVNSFGDVFDEATYSSVKLLVGSLDINLEEREKKTFVLIKRG